MVVGFGGMHTVHVLLCANYASNATDELESANIV